MTREWRGAEQLEPLLVPLTDLQLHPRNPRRGKVDEIAKSLDRFGQQKPVVLDTAGRVVE